MSAIAHMVQQTLSANHRPAFEGRPVSTGEARQMIQLRRQGLSLRQVAERIGRPRKTVERHIKKAGL